MLKKLLKYELRATSRTMGGEYLAVLGVALLLGLTMRLETGGNYPQSDAFAGMSQGRAALLTVLLLTYMALLIAVAVLTGITILQRFIKNLLGDEGYLMHTLPVSSKQLIAGKLLAALLWIAAGVVVAAGSVLLMVALVAFDAEYLRDLPQAILRAAQAFREGSGLNLLSFVLGMVLSALCGCANLVLQVYAACMIGHQFKRWFVPAGIVACLVLGAAQNVIRDLLGLLGSRMFLTIIPAMLAGGSYGTAGISFWGSVLISALVSLAFGAVYFFAADWLMRTRLNLE